MIRLAARPQPEWRDFLRTPGAERAYAGVGSITSAAAQFPWVALVWPNVQPTPTWRAIVRNIHITNMGNVRATVFWVNTNSAFALNPGQNAIQDNGFLGPFQTSQCQVGTLSSAVATLGTGLWSSRSVVNTDTDRDVGAGKEWLYASRVPKGMDGNPLSLALVVATDVANNLSIVTFEWVELP